VNLWADLGTERLPFCRLRVLVDHLPRDSAYVEAVHGRKALPMSETVWLPYLVWLLQVRLWTESDPKKRGPMPKQPSTPFDPPPPPSLRERLEDLYRRDRERRGVTSGD
jgi:hypothetical protein